MIICTKCGCVYGGLGGWLGAFISGWRYLKIGGVEHILCYEDKDTTIEGE